MPRSEALSEQMRSRSRTQIILAARSVFASKGYFNSRVSEIARAAGMSQGNVYWYFSSKEEVLRAVLSEGFERVRLLLDEARVQPGPGVRKLTSLTDRYIVLLDEISDFFIISTSLMAHGGAPFFKSMGFDTIETGEHYHKALYTILSQVKSEEKAATVDANIMAMLFFAFFNGLAMTYGRQWTTVPHEIIREAVIRMLGVGTPTRKTSRKKEEKR